MRSVMCRVCGSGLLVLLGARIAFSGPVATSQDTYNRLDATLTVSVYAPGDPCETGNPIQVASTDRVLTDYTYVLEVEIRDKQISATSLYVQLDVSPRRVITSYGSSPSGTTVDFMPGNQVTFRFDPPLAADGTVSRHYFTSPMLPGPSWAGLAGSVSQSAFSTSVLGPLGPHLAPKGDRVHHVDIDATGAADGSRWSDAYNHLQDAIEAAAAVGGEIRVAQGIYRPDTNHDRPRGSGDRAATFTLISNVTIRGGYAGCGEPWPDARDVEQYETILSGDLAGNDSSQTLYEAIIVEPSRAENSRRIVTANNVDRTAVLDGFTIAHGNNDAIAAGSALSATGSPTVATCKFLRNTASFDPTALLAKPGKAPPSSRGGAVLLAASVPGSEKSPLFINCIFQNNCAQEGSALSATDCDLQVINCTFVGNASDAGGTLHCQGGSPMIVSTILWGNHSSGGMNEATQISFRNLSGPGILNYCCIQGLTANLPGFGNMGEEPLFANQYGGDFHLRSQAGRWDPKSRTWVRDGTTSPCIDSGDRAAPVGAELFPNGGIVNMGAYGGTSSASRSYFGEPVCETIVAGDINGDCKVDWTDLCLMAAHWCGGPASMPLLPSKPTPPPQPAPPPAGRTR